MIRKLTTLFLLLFIFASCENDLAEIEKIIPKEDFNKEIAKDVTLFYSDSAIIRVRIQGAEMVRHLEKEDPREEFTQGIKADFFGNNGKVNSVLTSKHATRYESKNQIIIRDSVVWQSSNNEKLETEELIWDEKNERVFSNRYVRITNPDEIIYGYGFEANQEFTEWTINQIDGRIKVKAMADDEDKKKGKPSAKPVRPKSPNTNKGKKGKLPFGKSKPSN